MPTDGSGSTHYTYDSLDRLVSKSASAGTLNYTYDAAGNVASMSSGSSGGVSVSYTYDNLNRLSTVVDNTLPAGHNTTTYGYDPASNLVTATYPNGLQAVLTYDQLNRLSDSATAVSAYQYGRDANGNILTATEANNRTVTYTYDGIDELTRETVSNDPSSVDGSVSYSLSPVGNRLEALNRATGKLEYQPVTALTLPHRDKLLQVRVEGEHDPLRPSTGHPFWVKRGDAEDGVWMPAGEMQVGDRWLTVDGR